MLVFVFLIAFSLALAVLAAGLFALNSDKGVWIKTAGFILIVGGALDLACAGFHGLKYYFTGAFEGSYSGTTCSMMDQGGVDKGGMMSMDGDGMMGKRSKKEMMDKKNMKMGDMDSKQSATGDSTATADHESHLH
ncbi:MAG TPA: hypothetical protein VMU88_00175 [bacterium]|nr:hypothetical protein [bacterium]